MFEKIGTCAVTEGNTWHDILKREVYFKKWDVESL